jgi:hypothetical protein
VIRTDIELARADFLDAAGYHHTAAIVRRKATAMALPLTTKDRLRQNILAKAISHLGEREVGTTNSGPEVNQFLAYVGLDPGYSWCMAFAVYIAGRTAEQMGLRLADTNLVKTASCSAQASHARTVGALIAAADVLAGKAVVQKGDLMLMWEGGDYHHTGIVEVPPSQNAPIFGTIEGNTNDTGAREGTSVLRQRRDAREQVDGRAKYGFVRVV